MLARMQKKKQGTQSENKRRRKQSNQIKIKSAKSSAEPRQFELQWRYFRERQQEM